MSKFKRALSVILAIAMVFGSLSCLGAVVAPKASAAEGTSQIDSYASLAAAYDKFIYFGTEFYEIDITQNADGTLSDPTNHKLTDYYVDPGQILEAKFYLKSDMYCGEGVFIMLYENDFFDVRQLTQAVPANTATGYTQAQYGPVNTNHTVYQVNGMKQQQTSANCYTINWMKARTGYTQTQLEAWDFSQIVTSLTDNGQNQAYLFNSDEWLFTFFVKIRDDVAEGDTGSTYTMPGFWKCDDYDPTATKQTTWNGRNGNIAVAPRPENATAQDDFDFLMSNTKNLYLCYGTYNHVFFDDLEHTFTVGTNPDDEGGSDTPSGPVAGTSKIDSYASLAAAYDKFIYFGTEFYEVDITKNADGTLSDPTNHILTDYYVDPGQILEAKFYLKSDMYCGEGVFIMLYENDFFDVRQLTQAVPANTATGYTQAQYGPVNTNHTVYQVNGMKQQQTSANCYTINWMKARTGYTQEQLEAWDFSQIVTSLTDNGQNQAYLFNSDEWLFTFFVKIRDDVAEGDTGSTYTMPGFWKCDDYDPDATKQTTWNGRNGNIAVAPRPENATADDDFNFLMSNTKNLYLCYGTYNHVFFDDLEHTFTVGNPPAAGSKTAKFVVDGETYDSATYAAGAEIAAPATNPGKEGFVFKGWALEGTTDILTFPQTMGNADVTYVAIFEEVAKFTATFVVDGVTVSEAEYATGAAIVAPADPSKTGYNFAGWSPAVGTMGSADITFNATWTAKSYNVTYKNGDVTHQTLPVSFDSAYTLPVAPTKLGYEFAGWVDGQGNPMPAKHTVDADVTYFATFRAGTYTATFKANGGTFADGSDTYTVDVEFGQPITAPAAPSKTGNNFLGWSPEVGNMTAEGMTFTAQWEAAQIGVYFMDGEEVIDSKTGSYGSDISAISNPSKDGYTFAGWVDADGAPVQFPITLGTEAVYVYAKWTAKPYYIEFYGYAGSSASDWISGGDQLCGDAIATPDLMDYRGYTFIGWFDADGNPMPETVPAVQNQAYYARYEAIKYVATFDANGGQFADGEATATYEGIYNSTIVKPANPTKEGHTFSKWSPTVPNRMPASNPTYVAQWTVNSYKINYYVDGELKHTDTYTYGADVTAWTYTPAEGVSFGGWGDQVPATMPAGDVNVYGTTGVNTYNAIFTINGEAYQTVPVAFGAAIVAPSYDVPAGYTFSGWSVDATMPAHDVTYNATLTANTYNAIFYLDEAKTQVYQTVPTVFGEEIEFPEDPTMPGKTFDFWDNDATVMGAGDMEFVAQWIDIEYYVEFYNAEGEIIAEDVFYWGDEITADIVEEPTKEGFEFKYWTVNGNAVTLPVVVDENITTEGSDAIVFEPYFSIIGYDIIYMVDGQVYKTETYEFGAAIEILADLVKEGYTFSGWDTQLPATMPAHDITVNGTFTVNQYDALFYVDGALVATVPTDFGATPVAPDVSDAKPGYTFQGWNPALAAMTTAGATYNAVFTAAGDTPYVVEIYTMDTTGAYGEAVVENYTGATDTTATYTPAAKTGFTVDADASVLEGTITADGNLVLKVYYIRDKFDFTTVVDGVEETNAYYFEEAVAAPADPAKTGYTFTGWDGEVPATMPAKDVTLTATWQINQYTISFVDTGDVAYDDITLDYDAAVGTVKEPVKTGYTFAGWDKEIPANMPAEDTVITATWTINQYTITFVDTGDVAYDAITQDYATDIADIADPVKTGYTFTGWDVEIPKTMPAANVTVTATWTVNYYNATFVINGVETVKSTAYGTMPEIPDTTRVGYTFTDWDKEVTVMPAEDVVYTAQYTANTYDAIFDANRGAWADGDETKTVPTVFDQAIIAPDSEPVRDGYIFSGWTPEVGNMTAEGMTFTAVWVQDLNATRVTNVVRTTAGVTSSRLAAYDITVKESPIKIQIACTDGSGFTWTYDRNDYKVPGDLTTSGLVAVKSYAADNTELTAEAIAAGAEVSYEVWTIVTVITEGTYKVRTKLDYSSASWESLDTAYDYVCKYDPSTTDESKIISVAVAAPAVKRGTVNPVTIVTADDVSRLRITMSLADGTERIVSYSQTSTVVDYTKNDDGTATWVLNIKFTYSGTAEEQVQNWTIWYRATGDKAWNETEKTFEVKVTRYEPVEETPDATYDPFTVVSVKAEATAVKAQYTPVVIVTTSDATKVRINNENGKATTYMQTSNNVTYADNGDGTATWTINYRFASVGEQTWGVQCRGNAWSTIEDAHRFTINITAA